MPNRIETIIIVICEPIDPNGVGGYEWRTDAAEADEVFKEFCESGDRVTRWNNVHVPLHIQSNPRKITEWVDMYYWSYPEYRELYFGYPSSVVVGGVAQQ